MDKVLNLVVTSFLGTSCLVVASLNTDFQPMGSMKPLSKFKPSSTKRIYFHPSVVKNFPKTGFKYTENFKFQKMLADHVLNNHSNYHEFHPRKTVHGAFSYDLDFEEYYSQFFNGPLYNFDVRKSSLSKVAKFDMYGLFSREFIPKGSCIGIYNGLYLVGGKQDFNSYETTNFGWDYAYDCERDMIDAGPIGNFGRFINHQDHPNVEAQSVVIDKKLVLKNKMTSNEDLKMIEDVEFLEVMGLYVTEDIYPGQELFTDYGDGYWAEKNHLKVRQESFYMHNKVLDDLIKKNIELKEEVEVLRRHVKIIDDKFNHLKNILHHELSRLGNK